MSTDFKTIFNDMKWSLGRAKDNVLSYFLANLGMVFVIAIIVAIVAIPLIAVTILTHGTIWVAFGAWTIAFAQANPWLVGGVFTLLAIPIITLFFIVLASIYGMSKKVVETGDTTAETAFSYFRHKFLTFAGAGVMLTIIILLPPWVMWGAVSILSNYVIVPPVSIVLSVITFVWLFITMGLCSLVFPAMTNGKGVQEAFKESFNLAINRFDRVFGLWTGIIVLLVAIFSPAILYFSYYVLIGFVPPIIDPVGGAVLAWSAIAALLWLLILYPMVIIARMKVYAELTGGEIALERTPDVPLF